MSTDPGNLKLWDEADEAGEVGGSERGLGPCHTVTDQERRGLAEHMQGDFKQSSCWL